ncbi:MAG: hypothetical protein L3K08_06090, partial [Thermoplasmata archaeon]|nr:hypothetical protein [Thermoplasmata archaeon]
MYGLTSAEYQTVRAILDHPRGSERERIASSNVPSSTYSTARRRIFGEGWLSDLMIPNPGPTGMTGVELRLSRPSMDERRPIATAWREDQDCVILWEGIHVLFGIFFRHGKRSPPLDRAAGSPAFRVLASRSQGAVPVFFDYSGLWDHFGGAGPPPTYPAGLDLSTPAVGDRMIEASGDLLVRNGDPTPGTSRWLPILRTSRRHRELLEAGVMQPRTVL